MKFNIERSSSIDERNMKFLFWGDTGSRKTETILRNFPRVLLIDTEYNSDLCADVEEIPEFMRFQTKDPREIRAIIEAVKKGELKFVDGQPFETFAIDSVSILWYVQQEVGTQVAEKRAIRYNRDVATANMTQGDWAAVKRPLKELTNALNGTGIKYVVCTARSKDLYHDNGSGEMEKIGLTEDTVKGMRYDMNAVLNFGFSPKSNKWFYHVDKVQGGLGKIFVPGSYGEEFPFAELDEYAGKKRASTKVEASDVEVAEDIAQEQEDRSVQTKEALVKIAADFGIGKADVIAALNRQGIEKYDVLKWDEMVMALQAEGAPQPNGHH